MERDELKRIVEALIFVSDKPVAVDTLKEVVKESDAAAIRAAVVELNNEYAATGRSFSVKELAGGYLMMTDPSLSQWIAALFKKKPERLTGPSLETLAIIAYKQPITRSEIEAIRGVNVERILHTLEEKELIRTRGRLEAPGRPILYGTTTEFLQHFGLKSLDELPKLKEFQESDLDFIRERERARLLNTETGKLEEESPARPHEAVQPAADLAEAAHVTPPQDAGTVAPAPEDATEENVNGPEEIAQSN